jgi:phosphoribosyl 1,2-cyclic phosphodiesterase
MYIKCWGARGSIPVSGKEYNKYGGDTTCMEIRANSGHTIIVDAGTGIRRLGNQLITNGDESYNFLFTHAHWDHLMGFPFFKPLYRRGTILKVYRCPYSGTYAQQMITRILTPPNFPVKYSDLSAEIVFEEGCPDEFNIGSITVVPIHLSHPNGGRGYKFVEDGKAFVFLTDNELGFVHPGGLPLHAYAEFSEGADFLIHDAEYTPKEYETFIEWGHSSYADVLDLATRAGIKKLGLFHINQERSDQEMDHIVSECRQQIKQQEWSFDCLAVGSDMEFEL